MLKTLHGAALILSGLLLTALAVSCGTDAADPYRRAAHRSADLHRAAHADPDGRGGGDAGAHGDPASNRLPDSNAACHAVPSTRYGVSDAHAGGIQHPVTAAHAASNGPSARHGRAAAAAPERGPGFRAPGLSRPHQPDAARRRR